MSPDADPLDRAAHFAACDFYDHCVDLNIAARPEDFSKVRGYFRRHLAARHELLESADEDLEPVTRRPLVSRMDWAFIVLFVCALVAVMVLSLMKH